MNARNPQFSFYHGKINVKRYIESRRGLDGGVLVDNLRSILDAGSSVLELGIGPGTDLLLLSESFEVVGSDYSAEFLKCFRQKHEEIELIELNAVTISTSRKFDCVYSNKVLHHLSPEDLRSSLQRQSELVIPGGIVFHSFWLGDEEITVDGLRFAKYMPETIVDLFSDFGEVIITEEYTELSASDSFFVAARI